MTCYSYQFEWPYADPTVQTVQITGNFDNWSKSNEPLIRQADSFQGLVKLREKQKLVFKFIINDSEWVVNDKYKIEYDENGIQNNYVDADELTEVQEFERDETYNPELEKQLTDEKEESAPNVEGSPNALTAEVANDIDKGEDSKSDKFDVTSDKTDLASDKIDVSNAEDKSNLTQVLTSTSSFAAVSIPGSAGSGFEHLNDDFERPFHSPAADKQIITETPTNEDDADDQFNTPTNSLFNSTVFSTPSGSTSNANQNKSQGSNTADTSIINFNINSRNNSYAGKQNMVSQSDSTLSSNSKGKDEIVEILKAPGAYPTSPSSQSKESYAPVEPKTSGKRENLISRFKNLFKY